MHGKKISTIYWPDTESEQGRMLSSKDDDLILDATYHGDHDEFWIVQKRKITGREVARYNPRYVESIIWKED